MKKITIIIIVFLVISGFVWFFVNNKSISSSQLSNSIPVQSVDNLIPKINTSDWKTYNNSNFKFSVKYPPYLVAEELFGGDDSTRLNIYGLIPNTGEADIGYLGENDENFPAIAMAIGNSDKKCGDNVYGGIAVTNKTISLLKVRKLGDHIYSFASSNMMTPYGTSNHLYYFKKDIPCVAVDAVISKSPSVLITEKGYSQSDLLDTIMTSFKVTQ